MKEYKLKKRKKKKNKQKNKKIEEITIYWLSVSSLGFNLVSM